MKKIIIGWLLLFMCMTTVSADVLIEPEDSFYRTHSDECTSERKYYQSDTKVSILESPNDQNGYSTAPSGSIFYISWIYTDENWNQWGLYDGSEVSYWVKMDHLKPLYSHDEFMTEHRVDTVAEEREIQIKEKGYVVLYQYPGSDWITDIIDTEWIGDNTLSVQRIYVDENGTSWGYIPYYMQHKGWMNLDNPITVHEPERNAPVIFIPTESPLPFNLIAGLVIGICSLTGIITFLKRKKK